MVLTVLFVLLVSSTVMAEDKGKHMGPPNFEEFKARLLEKIDSGMAHLQDRKQCIQSAANMEDLKKCRPERPEHPGHSGERPQGRPFQPNTGR